MINKLELIGLCFKLITNLLSIPLTKTSRYCIASFAQIQNIDTVAIFVITKEKSLFLYHLIESLILLR